MDLQKLRAAVEAGEIEWARHVLERLASRGIPQQAVTEGLHSGECIEEYPDTRPFPSALFLGWHGRMPLHIVAAMNETVPKVFVITAYRPDLEHFEPDFKTRRKK